MTESFSASGGERGTEWCCRAKATKRSGMDGNGSESTDSTGEAGEPAPRDPPEGSGGPGMGHFEGQMARRLGRGVISTRQEKLAELARVEPKLKLTAPAHHPDEGLLREAHRHTREDGAAGVDGVSGYSRDHRSGRPQLVYGPVKTGPVGPAVRSETGRRDDRTREALEGGLPLQNLPDLLAYLTTLSATQPLALGCAVWRLSSVLWCHGSLCPTDRPAIVFLVIRSTLG